MLPHPAHARQVVLELRELDLELALGAHGVLGEDVEDQLRAVDDARLRAHSRATAAAPARARRRPAGRRRGLAVRGLELLELPLADVGPPVRVGPVLRHGRDRLDARRARELAQLGELLLGVDRRVSTATTNPRSGSAAGAGSGWRDVTG